MSLKEELSDPESPIRQYICFVGTLVADAKRGKQFEVPFKRMLGLDSLPREMPVGPVEGANGGTVGTAFDYRLRYQLAPCRSDDFVAKRHCGRVARSSPSAAKQLEWFFANLDDLAAALVPAGACLADGNEELLNRYCIVLAQVENACRSGADLQLPPPTTRRSDPAGEPLLALATNPTVRDVANLSRSAEQTFRPLIESVSAGMVAYHPNPDFAGSRGIGGADADCIIGDTIFEFKATRRFGPTPVRNALLQLVGYCLLDYDDRYAIRNVGLYFARQEWVVSWPLWELVFPPSDVIRWTQEGHEPSDDEIVERLQKLRRLMEVVVSGGSIGYEAEFGCPRTAGSSRCLSAEQT